jgi:hypothetical protein
VDVELYRLLQGKVISSASLPCSLAILVSMIRILLWEWLLGNTLHLLEVKNSPA